MLSGQKEDKAAAHFSFGNCCFPLGVGGSLLQNLKEIFLVHKGLHFKHVFHLINAIAPISKASLWIKEVITLIHASQSSLH